MAGSTEMITELVHRYRPQGNCITMFQSREPEVLFSGPAGTGKSRACLEKLHTMMLLNPGARGFMVRKTAVSLTNTALVTFREHVIPEAVAAGAVTWFGGSAQEAAQYRYANGSSITVGGMDRPDKVMSSEYDVCYVQEATELTVTDWEAITTRLRNGRMPFQQLLADCNPSHATHWLKQRCDQGTSRMIPSQHSDNPTLIGEDGKRTPRGEAYLGNLDRLTGVRRLRLRDGIWASAEGVIYETFDTSIHLIDRFKIPDTWHRIWAIDFGFTNPCVIQRWAVDPDGRLILYREMYRTQRTIDLMARDLLDEVAPGGVWSEPKPDAVICDHDAAERRIFSDVTGFGTTAAMKKVGVGIQAVQARLRAAGDGRPRLFLMRDALTRRDDALVQACKPTCTAEEMPGYVWRDGKQDEPDKHDDHGCDTLRYVVASEDLVLRSGFRGWL